MMQHHLVALTGINPEHPLYAMIALLILDIRPRVYMQMQCHACRVQTKRAQRLSFVLYNGHVFDNSTGGDLQHEGS